MTTENQGADPGAASSNEPAPPAPATPPSTEPKFEVKEGSYFVDGKKMVRESDLIAAKQGLESKLETQQTAHNQAIDAVRLELSSEQQRVASLTAELSQAKEAQGQGATTNEEVAGIKQQLTEAQTRVDALSTEAGKALEYRKALLKTQYPGVTDEQLADKDMKALDSFEEALKALASGRGGGPGPYAIGGAGAGAAQMTEMERAKQVLSQTPYRGVREPAEQK